MSYPFLPSTESRFVLGLRGFYSLILLVKYHNRMTYSLRYVLVVTKKWSPLPPFQWCLAMMWRTKEGHAPRKKWLHSIDKNKTGCAPTHWRLVGQTTLKWPLPAPQAEALHRHFVSFGYDRWKSQRGSHPQLSLKQGLLLIITLRMLLRWCPAMSQVKPILAGTWWSHY